MLKIEQLDVKERSGRYLLKDISSHGFFGFNRRFYYVYDLDDIWNHPGKYAA